MLLVGFDNRHRRFGGKVTRLARAWQWAATALTLGVALPVLNGDVLLVAHGATPLVQIASLLP